MKKRRHYLLETNVDDCSPEVLSYLIERLIEEGALDAHILQALMKKGRFGYIIRVIADDAEKFSRILMEESGTLGVRVLPFERFEAERRSKTSTIEISGKKEKIRVKESEFSKKPEFEDLRKLARKYKTPLRRVIKKVDEQL